MLLRKIGAVTERLKFPDCAELEQIAKDRDIMIQVITHTYNIASNVHT